MIASTLDRVTVGGAPRHPRAPDAGAGAASARPELRRALPDRAILRYGENPHQQAAGIPNSRRAALARCASCKAKSCRTPTCSTSTPRRVSSSNSPNRPPPSSSTPIRAVSPPVIRSPTPTSRARCRCAVGVRRHHRLEPSARRRDGAGDRDHLHRSRDRPDVHPEALTILAKKPSLRVAHRRSSAFAPDRRPLEVRSILGRCWCSSAIG